MNDRLSALECSKFVQMVRNEVVDGFEQQQVFNLNAENREPVYDFDVIYDIV